MEMNIFVDRSLVGERRTYLLMWKNHTANEIEMRFFWLLINTSLLHRKPALLERKEEPGG